MRKLISSKTFTMKVKHMIGLKIQKFEMGKLHTFRIQIERFKNLKGE